MKTEELVDFAVTSILAIPNPNRACVWAQVQLLANHFAELAKQDDLLLRKYISHVGEMEGADFLSDDWRSASFSDAEWTKLQTLAKKALEPSK